MRDSKFLLRYTQRRPIALAIWTLLIAPIGLIEGQPGFWVSMILISLIGLFSALALLILTRDDQQTPRWIPITVSIAVPFFWAMLLATSPAHLLLLGLFAAAAPSAVGMYVAPKDITDVALESEAGTEAPAAHEIKPTPNSMNPFPIQLNGMPEIDEETIESLEVDEDESPDLTQWLKRSLTEDGDLIEGGARVDFAEGQRETTVHVSFCPPFQSIPEVTTEDLNGDDLEIRVAAVFPFGVRLSVRRPAAVVGKPNDLPMASGRIGFVAVSIKARRVA